MPPQGIIASRAWTLQWLLSGLGTERVLKDLVLSGSVLVAQGTKSLEPEGPWANYS